MKLLIVTYSFAPDLTPRAFRLAAVAEQLASLGHEVHVLCATASDGQEVPGVQVHRVPDPLLRCGSQIRAQGAAAGRQRRSRAAKSLMRQLFRALYWPDYAFAWILPAVGRVRQLQRVHGFDWVITSSHPFSGHVVWLLGRKKSAAGWLVDIGDPYSLLLDPAPYNRAIYGTLSSWIEGRVVRAADRITTTTEATAAAYKTLFVDARSKIDVIPPLMSLPDVSKPGEARGPRSLVFVGTLYRSLRNPTFLLRLFHRLTNADPDSPYELHFYGNPNDCGDILKEAAGSNQAIVLHGLVDRVAVAGAMARAHALVNIGNRSLDQLGSKVVEYMAIGRPIVNIVSHSRDISEQTLADYPSRITFHQRLEEGIEDEEIAAAGQRLEAFLKAPPVVPSSYVSSVRNAYSAGRITEQYLEALTKRRDAALRE